MSSTGIYQSDTELLNQGLRPFDYWRVRAIKVLRSWRDSDDTAGYKTGLAALDEFIRLVPGEVTVLGGRPGSGKTALALQVAANMFPRDDGTKRRVAVFSAEMSGWSLYMRFACAISEVSMFKLRSGKASDVEYELTERAVNIIRDYPLLVDDNSRPDTEYMRQELELMKKTYDVRALIFDFLELSGDAGNNQEQKLSRAMQNLKAIAKDYEIPVIVISQLSREVEARADKIPQLDDLRYSGMIEQLADQVLLLTRPQYYLDRGMKVDMKAYEAFGGPTNIDDPAYVFVAKNRNGATGVARLAFDGPNMRFDDIVRVDMNEGIL